MRLQAGDYIDITGERFGMLTVIGFSHFGPWPTNAKRGRRTYWLCECDCGKEVVRRKDSLRNNRNSTYISCGCMAKEVNRQVFTLRHANGLNPVKRGDDHWTRKDPIRAAEIAIRNLDKVNKKEAVDEEADL